MQLQQIMQKAHERELTRLADEARALQQHLVQTQKEQQTQQQVNSAQLVLLTSAQHDLNTQNNLVQWLSKHKQEADIQMEQQQQQLALLQRKLQEEGQEKQAAQVKKEPDLPEQQMAEPNQTDGRSVVNDTNRQADGAANAVLSKQVNALKQELSIEKRTVQSLRTQSNMGAVEKVKQQLAEQQDLVKMMQRQQKAAVVFSANDGEVQKLRNDLAEQQQQLAEQQDLVKMMQRQQKAAVVVSSTDRIVSKKGKQIVSEEGQVII